MSNHYLAEVAVYRNDDAIKGAKNRYGDESPETPSQSRELLKVFVRAETLDILRSKVEAVLTTVSDVHENADGKLT